MPEESWGSPSSPTGAGKPVGEEGGGQNVGGMERRSRSSGYVSEKDRGKNTLTAAWSPAGATVPRGQPSVRIRKHKLTLHFSIELINSSFCKYQNVVSLNLKFQVKNKVLLCFIK